MEIAPFLVSGQAGWRTRRRFRRQKPPGDRLSARKLIGAFDAGMGDVESE